MAVEALWKQSKRKNNVAIMLHGFRWVLNADGPLLPLVTSSNGSSCALALQIFMEHTASMENQSRQYDGL
jgi:hypothetical protein